MAASVLPELIIDFNVNRELAENIWHAQKGGYPEVLTYNGSDFQEMTRANRKDAMRVQLDGEVFYIPKILSRDEYPFACTNESKKIDDKGSSPWIGHIPGKQNSSQGGLIAALIKKHNLKAGSRFKVSVINYK